MTAIFFDGDVCYQWWNDYPKNFDRSYSPHVCTSSGLGLIAVDIWHCSFANNEEKCVGQVSYRDSVKDFSIQGDRRPIFSCLGHIDEALDKIQVTLIS